MNSVAVIIPVYIKSPKKLEQISILQCKHILNNYPIIFVSPEGLDTSEYSSLIPNSLIEFFDASFFTSVKSYNRLMLTLDFYKRFSNYNFILIYQTDAFVFKDELKYWCSKDYDYIGAPIQHINYYDKEYVWKVGNGGFSLRKTESFINILSVNNIIGNYNEIIKKYFISGFRNMIKDFFDTILKITGRRNRSKEFIKNYKPNEDYFWGHYAPLIDKKFKVATFEEAIKFSFEEEPEKFYELNERQLPFGCHGWWKINREFWKNFINDVKLEPK